MRTDKKVWNLRERSPRVLIMNLEHKIHLIFLIIWFEFGYLTSTMTGRKCPNPVPGRVDILKKVTALALGRSPDFAGLSLSPLWYYQIETWIQNTLDLFKHLFFIWLFHFNQNLSQMPKCSTGSGLLFDDSHCFGARSVAGLHQPITLSTMVPPTWNLNTKYTWALQLSGCNLVVLPHPELVENVQILNRVG